MPLFLIESHPAAARRADLPERLARIRRHRPGALVDVRLGARQQPQRLLALVNAADAGDARAVWALGSLAAGTVRPLAEAGCGPAGSPHPLDKAVGQGGNAAIRQVLGDGLPLPEAAGPVREPIHQQGERDMEEDIILARARARGAAEQLPYAGALLPEEAWLLLKLRPDARLVDIRSRPEWELVGRVPGALEVEFMEYPDWTEHPDFLPRLRQEVAPDALVFLLCRSGQRSHRAATQLARAGYRQCFNVLEGFEGDKDGRGQRTVSGWRNKQLPWRQ